jgi:hypothetical protein
MMSLVGSSLFIAHQQDLENNNEHGWLVVVFRGIYKE